jgi:hypothetical protein
VIPIAFMHKYTKNIAWRPILKRVGFFALLSLPILCFVYTFSITNRHGALYGDWDYFAQVYEAARVSILTYHQFPWWNPWVIGGVPLYANPQFGLISIQMPLVLVFGTLVGLHLAILVYYLLGFWGMYYLLGRLGGNRVLRVLLSYVWVFATFPAWHIAGGHLTFAQYLLAPWLFLALLSIRHHRGWLWFGLVAAFLIDQTMHYMTIQMLFIGALYALAEISMRWREHKLSWWTILRPYVLACVIVLLLAGPRIALTLGYMDHFTRIPAPENANASGLVIDSLVLRHPIDPIQTYHAQFGWAEYTAYFGVFTLALLAYLFFRLIERRQMDKRQWVLLGGMAFLLLLAFGPFSPLSPYSLLKDLPVFQQMQVASRWLGWFLFAAILFLVRLPRKPFVYIVLVISILDVFTASRHALDYVQPAYTPPTIHNAAIDEQAFYQNQPDINRSSLRFLSATQANIGDVFGYEPIGEFSIVANNDFSRGLTLRCGSNSDAQDCPFVLTKNAAVTSWTPQRITLKRTANGPIELNMNPGYHWYANGKQLFTDMRDFELKQRFIIADSSSPTITIEYRQ